MQGLTLTNDKPMLVLGIETTCDETAASVVRVGADGRGTLPGVPDFTSKSGPLSKGDSVLLQHITDGFQTPGSVMAMPPKGGNPDLTEDDVIDVLYYIRGKFGS